VGAGTQGYTSSSATGQRRGAWAAYWKWRAEEEDSWGNACSEELPTSDSAI